MFSIQDFIPSKCICLDVLENYLAGNFDSALSLHYLNEHLSSAHTQALY